MSFVDEIYKDVKGAQRDEQNGTVTYFVPCDTAMNISWTFRYVLASPSACIRANMRCSNNETFPMHPIDTTVLGVDDSGNPFCQGSISGMTVGLEGTFLPYVNYMLTI